MKKKVKSVFPKSKMDKKNVQKSKSLKDFGKNRLFEMPKRLLDTLHFTIRKQGELLGRRETGFRRRFLMMFFEAVQRLNVWLSRPLRAFRSGFLTGFGLKREFLRRPVRALYHD